MNDNGYIKLHRKILDWQWFSDPYMLKLFITLCIIANYKDGYFKNKKIKRGQLVTSTYKLAELLEFDRRTVVRCLEDLEKSGEIKQKQFSRYRIITIVNYDEYQSGALNVPPDVPLDVPLDVPNQRIYKNKRNGRGGSHHTAEKEEYPEGFFV